MRILVQAIITGFGLKLGSDIYKYVKGRAGFFSDQKDEDDSIEQQAAAAKPEAAEGA
jgi:hypothetical protein